MLRHLLIWQFWQACPHALASQHPHFHDHTAAEYAAFDRALRRGGPAFKGALVRPPVPLA